MAKKILVLLPVTSTQRAQLESAAAGAGEFIYTTGAAVTDEQLAEASVIIGNPSPARLHAPEALELLQLNSAGADSYCRPGVLADHTVLCNVAGAYGLSVSEHMLALTFALIRRFPQYVRNQEQGLWKEAGSVASIEGSTVLVMGVGDIGGSYAAKVKALGAAKVIGVRRTVRDLPPYLDEQVTIEDLDRVLPEADIVAMVLPGGDATEHVMNKERIALMKRGAFLINVGRGNAIDQDALCEALNAGKLGGAGLDVTSPEPLPADHPLWSAHNALITPHVAGGFWLPETFRRLLAIVCGNLAAYAEGKEFTHVVDRAHGY